MSFTICTVNYTIFSLNLSTQLALILSMLLNHDSLHPMPFVAKKKKKKVYLIKARRSLCLWVSVKIFKTVGTS